MSLVHKLLRAIMSKHFEALRLAEMEVRAQSTQRLAVDAQLTYLTSILDKELIFRNPEARVGMLTPDILENQQHELVNCQLKLRELMVERSRPLIDLLKDQALRVKDLNELVSRLNLCVFARRKQLMEEQARLKRMRPKYLSDGGEEEAERQTKASAHLCRRLTQQIQDFEARAEVAGEEGQQLKRRMLDELGDFEGAVQDVLQPNFLARLLSWGANKHKMAAKVVGQSSLSDPLASSSATYAEFSSGSSNVDNNRNVSDNIGPSGTRGSSLSVSAMDASPRSVGGFSSLASVHSSLTMPARAYGHTLSSAATRHRQQGYIGPMSLTLSSLPNEAVDVALRSVGNLKKNRQLEAIPLPAYLRQSVVTSSGTRTIDSLSKGSRVRSTLSRSFDK